MSKMRRVASARALPGRRPPGRRASNLLPFCLLLLLGLAVAPDPGRALDALLGPVEEMAVLEDFAAESREAWQATAGDNVAYTMDIGRSIPGVADSVMQLDFSRKGDPAGKQHSFRIQRSFPAGALGTNADGVRLLIGSPMGGKWWMRLSLRAGGTTYSHVLQPIFPDRIMVEHAIPFAEFKSGDRRLGREQVGSVDGVDLLVSVHDGSLYLDRFTTYRREKYASWLAFASSQPRHNIFERGQAATATLTPGGTVPAAAKAFRYEIVDFFEEVVARGTIPLDGSAASYSLGLAPPAHGYYELRAFWVDEAGKDLEERSCILAEGSLPPGVATFSLMPRTIRENIERFKELGADAFLGLHGDRMDVADRMGLAWQFGYWKWRYLEREKPDRSQGMAAWAAQRLREPPQPAYRFHIHPFCSNLAPPGWAKNSENTAPPYARWEDHLAMVRDSVAVEKHRYPHMSPRLYGVAWEVNLNMPPYKFQPQYTAADVVELHRRMRETIRAADPDSQVLGPCPSNMSTSWYEEVFRAGVLEYVDGIETHGYAENCFTPEAYDYPQKLAALRDLMRQYNNGRVLPIYVTEAGFRGQLGSKIIHRTQAQMMTRLAIILKGEGVKVFLPFCGADYDLDGWWGVCFNLEVENNPWHTQRISPKPAVNALAACADVLEGAAPVRRETRLGEDVWAYLFDRKGTPVLAVWTPGPARRITLPAGDAAAVEAVNIMGHRSRLPVRDGRLEVSVDGSPQYLIGVSSW